MAGAQISLSGNGANHLSEKTLSFPVGEDNWSVILMMILEHDHDLSGTLGVDGCKKVGSGR
jgi:hypothetical protein